MLQIVAIFRYVKRIFSLEFFIEDLWIELRNTNPKQPDHDTYKVVCRLVSIYLYRFEIKANAIPELKSIVRILMVLQKVFKLQADSHNLD